jgi:DNA repair protein RadA/Sms
MWSCRACGAQSPKWQGRCAECGAWNTLDEVDPSVASAPPPAVVERRPVPLPEVAVDRGGEVRLRTGVGELDVVLGGGLVAGSLVLVGGDPGVGKSTLLLMALDSLARRGLPCLYVTGEESLRQVRLRADRLGIAAPISLLAQTDFAQVDALVRELQPVVAVIDSVQTMAWPEAAGIPGSASQVREVAHRAMGLAKSGRTAVVLVGHITKSGELAGPKILEHFVDAVLYFEGDGRSSVRALRATKNRFGAAGEMGLFEMVEDGLREVPDASARLLAERAPAAPGTAVVASIEGSRPMLVEIQALVGRPGLQVPARTCVGVDRTRVQLLAAVLEKAGVGLHDRDLFVNVAGGVVLEETASDLGVICAVASSAVDRPIPRDTVVFGEVGLVGEVRGVGQAAQRLKEAARHGFRRVVAPASAAEEAPAGLEVVGVRTVREALSAVLGGRSGDARG